MFDPYSQPPAFGVSGHGYSGGGEGEPPVDPYTGRRGDLEYTMTPRPKITSTGFGSLPSKENGGESWTWGDNPAAAARTKQAIGEAWDSRGDYVTPEYRRKMEEAPYGTGWVNRNLVLPALDTLQGGVRAAGAGVVGTAGEIAHAITGDPRAARDVIPALAAVTAVSGAGAPVTPKALTTYPQPGARFVPGGPTGPIPEETAAKLTARAEAAPAARRALGQPEGPTSPTQLTYKEPAIPGAPIVERMPPTTEPYAPPLSPAAIGEDAREIARGHFTLSEKLGGRVSGAENNKFLDTKVGEIRTQDPSARIFKRGGDAVDDTIQDLNNALRDKDLSLRGTMEIDRDIGDRIGAAMAAGNKDQASRLIELQHALRDHVETVGQSGVTGGPEGFAALRDARKAWAISVRMKDVERIIEEAQATQNPQATFRNKIAAFARNEKLTRGWSKEDLQALKDAGKTGGGMEILRMMGSRLGPIGGYAMGGPIGGLAVGAGEAILAKQARDVLGDVYAGRLQGLVRRMGERVPGAGTGGVPTPPGLLGRVGVTDPGVALGGLVLEPPEDERRR